MQYKIPLPILLWQSKQVIGPFCVLLFVVCSMCFPGLTPSIITFCHCLCLLSRSVLPAPSCSHVFHFHFRFQDSLADAHPSHSHLLSQLFTFSFKINSCNLTQSLTNAHPSYSHLLSQSFTSTFTFKTVLPMLILVTPICSPSCLHSPSGSIVAISRGHLHLVSTRGLLKPIPQRSHYMLY